MGNTDLYAQLNIVWQSIMAQDDAFDLCSAYVLTSGVMIAAGLYLNWLDMAYTDLSQPWWNHGINDKFRVKDIICTAVGDMCISELLMTYGVFYNLTRGEDYGLNDTVIEKIRDGEWTYDYFYSVIADIYEDTNGNGQRDEEDFYGFAAENATNLEVYPFAFDIPITQKDADGRPKLVFYTEKAQNAAEKIYHLYWDTTGTFVKRQDYGIPILMFRDGCALFTTTWFSNAYDTFREMNDDYIIIPYPKWDEAQEKYLTGLMDNYSVLSIPITASDPEMVSLITEALNMEANRVMYPAYYEQALQYKLARDPRSIEMLDLLMNGRNVDFFSLLDLQIQSIALCFRNVINGKDGNFAHYYATIERWARTDLDLILDDFEENAKGK
jgi:hypothetical protein